MNTSIALILSFISLFGQQEAEIVSPPIPAWLMGCWDTDNGTREVWIQLHQDVAFGANVAVQQDGGLAFFEQLRIERTIDGLVLAAYPAGKGPTRFFQIPSLTGALVFANPDNESPQVIQYQPTDTGITASTMQLDGSDQRDWAMQRCTAR